MNPRRMWCAGVLLVAVACFGQSRDPDDSWWKQNYRFAGPAAASETPAVSPVVAQLMEVQNALLSMMHKADFAGDYYTAMAAAAQAAANARLIGIVSGQLRPPPPPAQAPPQPRDEPQPAPAKYRIALRDGGAASATEAWRDGLMLHYITSDGAHWQVRLADVDWARSSGLARPAAR